MQVRGRSKESFQCLACHQVISTEKCCSIMSKPTIIEGPKFCFRGDHISHSLPQSDKRRVYKGLFNIEQEGDSNVQPRIEDVLRSKRQSRVKVLFLKGSHGDSYPVTLRHAITNLTTLKIIDIHITKLHLTEELTPCLTDLELRNIPNECNFKVVVPTLKNISIQFLTPEEGGRSNYINEMLEAAQMLEKFDSYKLWVGDLKFASNHLEIIDLHRSDGLETLSIWAPNLKQLGLQACYEIESIKILKEHPTLSAALPEGHKPSTFTVNTLFANISKDAMRALKKSGRSVIKDANPDDSPMACMEAQHQKTHKMSSMGMGLEEMMMALNMEAMANLSKLEGSQGASGGTKKKASGGSRKNSKKCDLPPECAQQ